MAARGARSFGHPEVYAVVCALSFAVARFAPWLVEGYGCPLRQLTGVPCATCGMTRAFVRLAHGQAAAALGASPLGAGLAALAWAFAAAAALRLLLGVRWPQVGAAAARRLALLGAAALLANWIFLVVAERS